MRSLGGAMRVGRQAVAEVVLGLVRQSLGPEAAGVRPGRACGVIDMSLRQPCGSF